MIYNNDFFTDFRENTINALKLGRRLSDHMDGRLTEIAGNIWKNDEVPVDLFAVGGYGRRELCPYSDMDLMFLVPDKIDDDTLRKIIEPFLYALWDKGLKVGYSVRSLEETCAAAKRDMTILTSLLDVRLIQGRKEVEKDLRENIRTLFNAEEKQKYVQFTLQNRIERHKKFGETRFVLEPNIKDGKGGLRDYQSLFWISRVLYGARKASDLVKRGIIKESEARHFEKCYTYLLTIRAHLQDIAGRAEDRLHFDLQPALASRLGYRQKSNARAVERFMKHYFKVAKDVGDLTRIICAEIEAENEKSSLEMSGHSRDHFYGLALKNGRVTFRDKNQPCNCPRDMISLFRVSQETNYDIHPEAIRLITKNINRINDQVRNDVTANQQFLEVLTARKDAAFTLRRMNEADVLGRFVTEFRHAQALMQFDRYHVYTVDEHTFQAIDILHRIEAGELIKDAPLASQLIHEIENRRAIFIAMFLHDVGKGKNRDHSEVGAEYVEMLAPRFGLSEKGTRQAQWLVQNHLKLSKTAFVKDLQDEEVIRSFAEFVEDKERLRLLTILTTADIMAVGPGRWTAWKDYLITDLYSKTHKWLSGHKPDIFERPKLPESYKKGETRIEFEDIPAQHATRVNIFTPDRFGLFSLLCGGLTLAGASILDARIETLSTDNPGSGDTGGDIAMDSFTIQTTDGYPYDTDKRKALVREHLENSLSGAFDMKKTVNGQTEYTNKKDRVFEITPALNFISQGDHKPCIFEIVARDRPALLYNLATLFSDYEFEIKSAKITTHGLRATDVFYVSESRRVKSKQNVNDRIKGLKQALENYINAQGRR